MNTAQHNDQRRAHLAEQGERFDRAARRAEQGGFAAFATALTVEHARTLLPRDETLREKALREVYCDVPGFEPTPAEVDAMASDDDRRAGRIPHRHPDPKGEA